MSGDAALAKDLIISADAGGTFLDLILMDDQGRTGVGKALHTPEVPSVGILRAIAAASEPLGISAHDALRRCKLVFHGTTVTTNGIIERTGVPTGLLCTRGFEDTLYIGRVRARTEGLDPQQLSEYTRLDRASPIVPFSHIRGLRERTDAQGRVVAAILAEDVDAAVDALVAAGCNAIAVSLLHSYANPAHERFVRARVHARFPEVDVILSSDLAPIIGEFERSNTAVVNAYLNPLLRRHLASLDRALSEEGYEGDTLIMQSIGGVLPSAEIRSRSVLTLLSGPVGGIVGAQKVGSMIGEANIVTTDMGGTSFDVGVIVDGRPEYSTQPTIHRQIVSVPAVDIVTIGAGGGSAVWVDENGSIQVGPESVGARPGPACYGLGGVIPTVTDADVVLGYIDPASFSLGGRSADRDAAIAAFQREIGDRLGIDAFAAAHAVLQIVNNRMADLVRKATIERGHDPRDFVILAYGGSGPAHCSAYGAEIGAKKIVVPPYASIFSAYGIAHADIKQSLVRSIQARIEQDDGAAAAVLVHVGDVMADLRREADSYPKDGTVTGIAPTTIFSIDCRFRGQSTEITVPLAYTGDFDAGVLAELIESFKRMYDQNYGAGASSPDSAIELVNGRAEIIVPIDTHGAVAAEPPALTPADAAKEGSRPVYWSVEEGPIDTAVYKAERMGPGHRIVGPCLIELFKTTVPIMAGQAVTMDGFRNLVIEKDAQL